MENTKIIKIVVADDHTILRDGIRALLSQRNDMEIVGEATDGKEAVNKTLELSPDLVIMDIAMPEMDGLEATRRITRKNKNIKVLILTQHDNKEFVRVAIKAGASGFLPKIALGSDLISAIRTVYEGKSFLFPTAVTALVEDYRNRLVGVDPYEKLTTRQKEILRLIADGHTSRDISNLLFISLTTTLTHRTKIMEKLNIHNQTELIKYAMRKGIVNLMIVLVVGLFLLG